MAIDLFCSATAKHADATEKGESKAGNRAHGQIMKALKWLNSHESAHLLLPLLKAASPGTRLWAATYLVVHQRSAEAEQTLIKDSEQDNIHGFDAEMTLREWRAGRLKSLVG